MTEHLRGLAEQGYEIRVSQVVPIRLVRMLATGRKDENIARQLNVSLRTVSRTVSELIQRLNVESRFQAGVRAAQLGSIE